MFRKLTSRSRTYQAAGLAGAATLLLLATACGGGSTSDNNFPEAAPAASDTSYGQTAPANENPAPQPVAPAPRPAAPAPRPTAQAPRPAPAPAPSATLPAGTEFEVATLNELNSELAQVGDPVQGRVMQNVQASGLTIIPAGATVNGTVSQAKSAKRFGGQAMVEVTWQSVTLASGRTIPLEGTLAAYAKSETGKDTAKIAGGAAAGAILGKVLGGDSKDAAIGAAVGGGIGTAVASKKGQEAMLPAETVGMAVTTASTTVTLD